MKIFINKKFYLAGLVVILAGLFFMFSASSAFAKATADKPALAAECEKGHQQSYLSTFLNPVASLAEKVVKDFGYQVSLAAAPDPDLCGTCLSSDSVGCSGSTPTASVSWTAGPYAIHHLVVFDGTWTACAGEGGFCSFSGTKIVRYGANGSYIYRVFTNGVICTTVNFGGQFDCDSYPNVSKSCHYSTGPGVYNTGANTSYTVSSGLGNNTTYSWLVEAYSSSGYFCNSSAVQGYTNQPCGSFTTPNCAPPPPATVPPAAAPNNLSASCPSPGNNATLSWSPVAGATIYAVRVNNLANPWSECRPDPLDSCPDTSATSETIVAVPGASYDWWVHGCNASGCGPATAGNFTCTAPPPTCTPSCGGWSACSVSCGGGTQSRTCTRTDCSTYTETQSCNPQACAVTNNATCLNISKPASIGTGQQFFANVTMQNTGTKVWNSDGTAHGLGSQNPQDNGTWGLGRVALPWEPVNPGQSVTFGFTSQAPSTPGTYPFDWKMVEDGIEWFGQTCQSTMVVTPCAFTISKSGSGSGTVSASGISCGSDCSETYTCGTSVTLTASPASGSTFNGWSGDADCSDGVVTMSVPKSCTATFNVIPADFSLNSSSNIYATLVQGQDGDSSATTLTISSFYGFSSTVSLSVQSVSPSLPVGSTYNFSRTSLNQSQYSSGSTFSVHIGSGLSASQTYTITIKAIDGGLVRTTNVILNAQVRNPDWREI